MFGVWKKVASIVRDTRGATVVEYGLLLALVFLAILLAVMAVANSTITMWNDVNVKVTNSTGH